MKSIHNCNIKPETQWHIDWKTIVGIDSCEVIVEKSGERKIADTITPKGFVVEYQHSSISTKEIKDREAFYEKMVWVFDLREPRSKGRFEIRKGDIEAPYSTFRWLHAWKRLAYCTKPVFLHLGPYAYEYYGGFINVIPGPDLMFKVEKFYNKGKYGWGHLRNTEIFKKWLVE